MNLSDKVRKYFGAFLESGQFKLTEHRRKPDERIIYQSETAHFEFVDDYIGLGVYVGSRRYPEVLVHLGWLIAHLLGGAVHAPPNIDALSDATKRLAARLTGFLRDVRREELLRIEEWQEDAAQQLMKIRIAQAQNRPQPPWWKIWRKWNE